MNILHFRWIAVNFLQLEMPCSTTLIITTSPIPSNPSLEMISKVLESISDQSFDIIICFDGATVVEDGRKEEWKQGKISSKSWDNYNEYRMLLCAKLAGNSIYEWGDDEDFKAGRSKVKSHTNHVRLNSNIIAISHSARVGFALAVYSGLLKATTETVIIHQHDWRISTEVASLLPRFTDILVQNPEINYIGFVSRRSKEYVVKNKPVLVDRSLGETLTYGGLPFCRLHFWYDRIHLARVSFYMVEIFRENGGLFKNGDFIEDTFGHKQMQACKDYPLDSPNGWKKYGSLLYYPNDGKDVGVSHLNGRKYHDDAKHPFRRQSPANAALLD
jgi:hypothetical protein